MLRTQWPVDVVLDEFTIPPGESTGWHYHPVPILAVVRSGTLTRTLHDGTVEVSPPGTLFVEAAGRDRVHNGHNHGPVPVVLEVAYARPADGTLTVPAEPPCCARTPARPGPPRTHTSRRISPRTR
ncbi:cupin domain-containing protein [Streptomyces sp. NPDC012888]|uniref:cupin domain-containing protein n=1 Tax=Streptomyces sp. NPDC012888 TaxID=3364855 RepID=UPI0036C08A6C